MEASLRAIQELSAGDAAQRAALSSQFHLKHRGTVQNGQRRHLEHGCGVLHNAATQNVFDGGSIPKRS